MEFSGRIDHILSQINTLFKANNFLKDVDVYLMTKNSLCWILAPGAHVTTVPEIFVKEQRWCSYVPVGAKTNVSTTGFKWDLSKFMNRLLLAICNYEKRVKFGAPFLI